jgi:CheY-like chemotaxis protein/HPt (histidine-containing phosphotransfer) domain-containing protein
MDGFMVAEQIRNATELSGATVMMLSSAMPAGAAARCTELGVSSYLTKPVTQAGLIDAILVALGKAARLRPAADEARRVPAERALRILLAEDNVINRALATGILEKRGHSVVHAANGREAVEAAAQEDFDLIFMDVQMPEVDGLEATRRIREAELATGRRTPIAAMTAHAMAGDRERCLASGMDEYIAKPLHKDELCALVARVSAGWMPPEREVPSDARPGSQLSRVLPAPVPAAGPRALSIYPRAQLLAQLDGDEGLLRRMIALFHENTPQLLDQVRDSIARRSAGDLSRSVHSLLSSLGAFGATNAHQLSRRLEGLGEHGDFTAASSTFADLKGETARVSAALAEVSLGDGVPEFSRA